MSDNLQRVRDACREVAHRSKWVRIDEDRLESYAKEVTTLDVGSPDHDPGSHFLDGGDATAAFFLTLDSINFGSGYFPHLDKRPGKSGYFTVATSLAEHFRRRGPISADELATYDVEASTALFGQRSDNDTVQELMGLFAEAWNHLGRYLIDRFERSHTNLIESASGSAERLVAILVEMPFFDDVHPYEEIKVPLYKRAQLTAADLALAFAGTGHGKFDDLSRLTIFADNLVPHVLRLDGVLIYDDDLLNRINREELIKSGSPEEIEIRANAVLAVQRLTETLILRGINATDQLLDYFLWNRGQEATYKAVPRHRTRCVFY